LSEQILTQPVRIEVAPVSSTAEKIKQAVFHADKKQKLALLIDLVSRPEFERCLVFTRTKRDANRVSDALNIAGIRSEAIHGNKSQNARERALEKIKTGEISVLVATDIAARGIDIEGVTHVVNYDIPNIPESYVHRIGRTARAGKEGLAYSLCAGDERQFLADIERLIRMKLEVLDVPKGLAAAPKVPERNERDPRAQRNPRGGSRGGAGASGRESRGRDSRPSGSFGNKGKGRGLTGFGRSSTPPSGGVDWGYEPPQAKVAASRPAASAKPAMRTGSSMIITSSANPKPGNPAQPRKPHHRGQGPKKV
jgi:ATP-dependent RNA helicase RhlE